MNILNKLVLVLTLVPTVSFAMEKDKQLHLGVSTVIAGTTQFITDDWRISMSFCTLVGVGKEVYDEMSYGGFDEKDLAYDVAGCIIGTVIGDYGLYLYQDSDDATGIGYQFKF